MLSRFGLLTHLFQVLRNHCIISLKFPPISLSPYEEHLFFKCWLPWLTFWFSYRCSLFSTIFFYFLVNSLDLSCKPPTVFFIPPSNILISEKFILFSEFYFFVCVSFWSYLKSSQSSLTFWGYKWCFSTLLKAYFAYHKIQPYNAYNSVIFSKCI